MTMFPTEEQRIRSEAYREGFDDGQRAIQQAERAAYERCAELVKARAQSAVSQTWYHPSLALQKLEQDIRALATQQGEDGG